MSALGFVGQNIWTSDFGVRGLRPSTGFDALLVCQIFDKAKVGPEIEPRNLTGAFRPTFGPNPQNMETNSVLSTKEVICMAQEIAEKRNHLLSEMRTAFQAGSNEAAIAKAKELCGITESISSIQEAAC